MVGCVIVHEGKIIGEGFTSPYGGSHAEVNAIHSVKEKSLLAKSTLYVTLEPCSHYGKTPPCADLITSHKIPKVFIGLKDPHAKVAGKGIEKLQQSGCEVTVGVLENECRRHHKRFLAFQEKKRPYIILKWAETVDGFIAPKKEKRNSDPEPYWITNAYSRQLVHQWRSEEQAILAGTNTVLEDNPKLNVRSWDGNDPIRIIIDKTLKIPSNSHVFDASAKTIIITAIENESTYLSSAIYEVIDFTKPMAAQICNVLHKHSITSVVVEGGYQTLQTFIDENLWDEARIFKGNARFVEGTSAPKISGRLLETRQLLSDNLTILRND